MSLKKKPRHRRKPKSLVPEVVKKEEESIFDPGTTKVKDSFLDMLNGESAKMTAALQNSANWPGIMAAAKGAPKKIREMEAAMGLKHPAGKIGPLEFDVLKTAEPFPLESAELKRKGRNLLRRGAR